MKDVILAFTTGLCIILAGFTYTNYKNVRSMHKTVTEVQHRMEAVIWVTDKAKEDIKGFLDESHKVLGGLKYEDDRLYGRVSGLDYRLLKIENWRKRHDPLPEPVIAEDPAYSIGNE